MDEEQKWEGSPEFLAKKAKKERGVRVASFLASDVWKLDIKPYLETMKQNALARTIQVISDHAALAACVSWERSADAFEAALLETARDANLDLSEPTESEEPNIQP